MRSTNDHQATINSQQNLAEDPQTSGDTLAQLAESNDWAVRCAVAMNPNTPPATLNRLSRDDDWIRKFVAENPNTPTDLGIFEYLAKDEDRFVREAVASSDKASAAVLSILAKDDDYDVRCAVAMNPNATPDHLLTLVRDDYFVVADKATRRLATFPQEDILASLEQRGEMKEAYRGMSARQVVKELTTNH